MPCRQEIPQFVELQNRYGSRGLQVIGISMDDSDKPVRDFYRQFHINYPVGIGDSKLEQLYGGLIGLPINFVVGRDGRIYSKHIGVTPGAGIEQEIKALLATPAPSA